MRQLMRYVTRGQSCIAIAVLMLCAGTAVAQPERAPAGMETPAGFTFDRDVSYGPDEQWHKLDILYAEDVSVPRPAIVLIHGGGWRGGSKERPDFYRHMARYAKAGFVSLSIRYRLSTVAPFPAASDDCKLAMRWLRANAAKYGVDPARIGVIGGSAGGHLAGMIAVADDSKKPEPLGEYSSRAQAVVPVCGVFDLTIRRSAGTSPSATELFLGGTAQEKPELAREASPLFHVKGNEPPMLLIHGTTDKTVAPEQSIRMAEALKQAGRPHELILMEGVAHGMVSLMTEENQVKIIVFFSEHLKPK